MPGLESLQTYPALERPDLLAEPVRRALTAWPHYGAVRVFQIEPELADTAALTEAYGLPVLASANCVVVAGRRAGEERVAACVVRADTRADVNNVVRRLLDVRKASFLSEQRAVTETGMEYGGITPLGLPEGWRVLVAAQAADIPVAIIGSGVRRSKLLVSDEALANLPGAQVVDRLAVPAARSSEPGDLVEEGR